MMDALLRAFAQAHQPGQENGYLLSTCLTAAPPASLLITSSSHRNTEHAASHIRQAIVHNPSLQLPKDTAAAWTDILAAYHATVLLVKARAETSPAMRNASDDRHYRIYEAYKKVADLLIKGYNAGRFPAWSVPCMYVTGKWLRRFAMQADNEAAARRALGEDGDGTGFAGVPGVFEEEGEGDDDEENKHLEDAGRMLNRMFSCCISDRAPIEASRKWALYYVSNLLFKTYFKLNKPHLTSSILRSLTASSDTPPLTSYPKSHRATYLYYNGVTLFLSESYPAAASSFSEALALCPTPSSRTATASPAAARACSRNRTLILTYLIPCRLLTSQTVPSLALLAAHPGLESLFGDLCRCLRGGDLKGYDEALERGMPEFVKRRVYLTLERARDMVLRNVLRKVVLVGVSEAGKVGEKRSRIRIEEFVAGLRVANGRKSGRIGKEVDGDEKMRDGQSMTEVEKAQEERDEVECLIASAIYKNLMKGYIARNQGMVVLSKAGAFPGTGV